MKNRLINETSPYLLQHASNPVDWFPYGPEALQKAKDENKLLIISIGYFACHWCHVMEHESFENQDVANVMNTYFVSIKIDREERPDLDAYYLDAVHMLNQRGGWPLNCIAFPDGRAIWGGTYFKPDQWIRVLNEIVRINTDEPHLLREQAHTINSKLLEVNKLQNSQEDVSLSHETILATSLDRFVNQCDMQLGGFAGAPKFPMPLSFQYLLRMAYHTKRADVAQLVKTTLTQMAHGGIYDQLGGGFSRYSTDDAWKIPHFEKMLYDNAQLISLYAEAFRFDPNPLYRKIVHETLAFIKTNLRSEDGLFFASLDADSEGVEGKYYVWTHAEIANALGKDAALFCAYYGIESDGNWEHGVNVLLPAPTLENVRLAYGLSHLEIETTLQKCCARLLEKRQLRVAPALDYKVITAWNALVITGFVDAFKATGNQEYLEDAVNLGQKTNEVFMDESGHLFHSYTKGKYGNDGFLDDYAFLALAYLDLAQVTQQAYWLKLVEALLGYAIRHFLDQSTGLYYYTSANQLDINVRKLDYYDTVIASSNAALCLAFTRYARLRDDTRFAGFSTLMLKQINAELSKQPTAFSCWLLALYEVTYGVFTVKMRGTNWSEMLKSFTKQFRPDFSIMMYDNQLDETIECTEAFICSGDTCFPPVQSVEEMDLLIQSIKP